MLVLLPPSESKTGPAKGPALDIDSLAFPGLNEARRSVARALVDMCAEPTQSGRATARAALGLSAGQEAELDRNAALFVAPTGRVSTVYTGVLYRALDLPSLEPAVRRLATNRIAVASALFGLLRLRDRVPPYRLSAANHLPGLGSLHGVWHEPLREALIDKAPRVIVDLRSNAYAALCPIPPELADRTVVAKIWQDRGGMRTAVTHWSKHTKGLLARELVTIPARVMSPQGVCVVAGRNMQVELRPPAAPGRPWQLDVMAADH
ncbi:MAG: peroxide stress protein YaaA [Actinomycetes bacterium]